MPPDETAATHIADLFEHERAEEMALRTRHARWLIPAVLIAATAAALLYVAMRGSVAARVVVRSGYDRASPILHVSPLRSTLQEAEREARALAGDVLSASLTAVDRWPDARSVWIEVQGIGTKHHRDGYGPYPLVLLRTASGQRFVVREESAQTGSVISAPMRWSAAWIAFQHAKDAARGKLPAASEITLEEHGGPWVESFRTRLDGSEEAKVAYD